MLSFVVGQTNHAVCLRSSRLNFLDPATQNMIRRYIKYAPSLVSPSSEVVLLFHDGGTFQPLDGVVGAICACHFSVGVLYYYAVGIFNPAYINHLALTLYLDLLRVVWCRVVSHLIGNACRGGGLWMKQQLPETSHCVEK